MRSSHPPSSCVLFSLDQRAFYPLFDTVMIRSGLGKKETMNTDFVEQTPGEIDAEYQAKRKSAEDTILAQLELDTQAEKINQLRDQERAIKKRYDKVYEELHAVRVSLRALRAEREGKLIAALEARVSPSRLSELTGVHVSSLSHLYSAHRAASGQDTNGDRRLKGHRV